MDLVISIHALLAESDRCEGYRMSVDKLFLSTLSLRRATGEKAVCKQPGNISIHALLAESDGIEVKTSIARHISIHALLAESDDKDASAWHEASGFLSTLSLRRATWRWQLKSCWAQFLSTLSLRRATTAASALHTLIKFLSTLSLRRATAKVHKTVGHFCAYETNFMGIASSC